MKKTLSIIIPSYNVSAYIEECLDSFTKERIEDLEVLVIDDGSKDDTLRKARKYEEKFPGIIKVVHKENGGHGSTINTGLSISNGEYVKIVDGDDWVDWKSLTSLINILKKKESDMVLTSIMQVYPDKQRLQTFFNGLEEGKKYSINDLQVIDYITMGSIAIRTDILKNKIHITENCFYVDIEFNAYCIAYSNTIQIVNLPLYMYRLGNTSQSVSKMNMYKNIEMLQRVSLGMASFFSSLDLKEGSKKELLLLRIGKLIRTTMLLFLASPEKEKGYKKMKEYIGKVNDYSEELFTYVMEKWKVVAFTAGGSLTRFKLISNVYRIKYKFN